MAVEMTVGDVADLNVQAHAEAALPITVATGPCGVEQPSGGGPVVRLDMIFELLDAVGETRRILAEEFDSGGLRISSYLDDPAIGSGPLVHVLIDGDANSVERAFDLVDLGG